MPAAHTPTGPSPIRSRGELVGIYAELVPAIWQEARPLIASALARGNGGFAEEDILGALLSREMQLWLYVEGRIKGVVVTELVNYPRLRACLLVLCAGTDIQGWIHHIETLERWASAQGCEVIEAYGRRGWARLLKGWEQRTMLMKELDHAGR